MDTLLQPESALGNWRQWSAQLTTQPVTLGPLGGGRSNRSFLLDSEIGKMVLRINGQSSLLPGATRSNEFDIWQAASQQGIAPPLLHTDMQNRYLVSTYINSELPSRAEYTQALADQALNLLQRCHRLEVKATRIDYPHHIEQYWHLIEAKDQPVSPALCKQREPMQSVLDSLLNSAQPSGLCHHDPVTANFVGTASRLYLIDWEYAAHGLLIMDYAALATEWKISDELVLAKTGLPPASLAKAKALYAYLCSLWQALNT